MSCSKMSLFALFLVAVVAATVSFNACGNGSSSGGGTSGGAGTIANDQQLTMVDYATHLTTPWSLKFAPDGRLFFTEQAGRLRVIENGTVVPTPVLDLTSTTVGGEGGATGMDLDPGFASNNRVYLHYCVASPAQCQVVRVVISGNSGTVDKVLLTYPVSTGLSTIQEDG